MDGQGNQHRRLVAGKVSACLYQWLKNNGFPEGYQVLCMNCQFIKRAEEINQPSFEFKTIQMPDWYITKVKASEEASNEAIRSATEPDLAGV